MREVNRSALVPYAAAQMYDLVADIEQYPEFLPGCRKAEILSLSDDTVEASLEFASGAIRKSFATRNSLEPKRRIVLQLLDGSFKALSGEWRFDELGSDGCKVTLSLSFEFDNSITDKLFGQFFENICNRMIESFSKRAEQVYNA